MFSVCRFQHCAVRALTSWEGLIQLPESPLQERMGGCGCGGSVGAAQDMNISVLAFRSRMM